MTFLILFNFFFSFCRFAIGVVINFTYKRIGHVIYVISHVLIVIFCY